jgi:hypothetical protein
MSRRGIAWATIASDVSPAVSRAGLEPSTLAQGGLMAGQGLYTLASLVMIAALVADFIWVATTALHAMH